MANLIAPGILLVAVLLASAVLAVILSWAVGWITDIIQAWRHRRPDFREQRRTGRGHSE